MTHPTAQSGTSIYSLSTPVPVIDESVVVENLERVQTYMNSIGRRFRPHIKTHKIPKLARAQVQLGAIGINCQKLSEAEVFADAGIEDILITYNILGEEKLAPLVEMNINTRLSVTVDNKKTVAGLSEAFSGSKEMTVLVECDTGGGRCGVQSPERALALAKEIHKARGLKFGGILTYPESFSEETSEQFFSATLELLNSQGLRCPVVSYGGTPSLFEAHKVPSATEHRAGTYIYNDRAMFRAGHCSIDQCALHILSTVVSRPTLDRVIIDAGSKALTSDLLGFSDYGLILDYPDARIEILSEEHGIVDFSNCDNQRPEVGEKLRILPNHSCVISNLFDQVIFHNDDVISYSEIIAARGRVW